ncbi:protein kinase domain-containing protein [Nevskia ramosa]|uniref:protein kinase domain-containing protein n=1 Tax=Nevskia ramosa TaxID=64002 RepID=UPI0003B64A99|nr:protein kinase [Nevskia ramosa]
MSKKAPPEFGDESGPSLHSARWRFGEFELDETRRELRLRGELLKIEAKPLNLLMMLLRHPGEMITKNDLIDALWTGRIVTESVLGNCVAKLRQVLGDDGAALIKTVFGFGYRFDVEAQLLSDDAVTIAPPKLAFQPGDSPPMRPNWKLIRRLGRSGDCWLAEHTKTRAQRVFKFTTELHGLSALKREVTVYRLLHESLGDKACYVDLLDWNFDEPPWFVEAEYCAAGSLQEWFTARGGVERIPLSARLELIAQIAEALAEIHAVGVLHKDLKPANVFVVLDNDGRPTIRLADFGSSRLYDSEYLARLQITKLGFTQVLDPNQGETSGTPLYLAPEVLAGQPATVKADIYALGVMLYQFVTGNLSRRLEAGWEAAVDDEILREDINAAADGDPQRRLADPRELARRLRTIEARRSFRKAERLVVERSERLARALERARARRIGLMLAAATLIIGMITTSLFAWRANDARQHAEKEAARARAVGEFLAGGMFAHVNDDVRKVRDLSVKELVDRAAAQMPEQFEDQPDVKTDLHYALGSAYDALEYNIEADAELARAEQGYRKQFGEDSELLVPVLAKRLALSYGLGRLKNDLPQFERTIVTLISKHGQDNAALRDLRLEIARARFFLGQYDLAIKQARDLLALFGSSDQKFFVAASRLLGVALTEFEDLDEAEKVLSAAQEINTSIKGEHTRADIALLCNLAYVDLARGHYRLAESRLKKARGIADEWLREGSGWDNVIKVGLARADYLAGRKEHGLSELKSVRDSISSETAGLYDQSAYVAVYLAQLLNDERRYDEALDVVLPVLKSFESSFPSDSLRVASARLSCIEALTGAGRYSEAKAMVAEISVSAFKNLPERHLLRIRRDRLEFEADSGIVAKRN